MAESVDKLMDETHELGGSTVVVDRATPKVIWKTGCSACIFPVLVACRNNSFRMSCQLQILDI